MTFFEVLTAAINEFIEYGFDSEERLQKWSARIREAADQEMVSDAQIQQDLEKSLEAAYHRLVTRGGLLSKNVSRITLERIKPRLRAELDRRIMTSASLIKLNRQESMSNTLRRFQGWATSIPIGGSKAVDRREEKANIRKSLGKLPFEQRRVIIDQTHKLIANIREIVAVDNGAIAAEWHSHWRQPGYNYRKDHKERDDKVYVLKDSWAYQKGYIKAPNGFYEDITKPGEEVYCRCNCVYLYNLRQVKELLTPKGENALQSVQAK
jgi:hypothetical protein